jgi:hypothetical protein
VEGSGHIVGISDHCCHALTWRVLNDETDKVINRSVLRPADPNDCNLCAELLSEKDVNTVPITNSREHDDTIQKADQPTTPSAHHSSTAQLSDAEDLIGRTFLLDKREDGQRLRARIFKLIDDHSSNIHDNKKRMKFLLSFNDHESEEIITYNQLLEYLRKDEDNDVVWKLQIITSHQGPLTPNHQGFKGSKYNVVIEWENGEGTSEPLQVLAKDNPVTCAIYAKEIDLLDTDGWSRFKPIAKRQKKFTRMVNQAKLRSYNSTPQYNNGYELPRSYEQAMKLDEKNGNTKCQDAIKTELSQIKEYKTFINK